MAISDIYQSYSTSQLAGPHYANLKSLNTMEKIPFVLKGNANDSLLRMKTDPNFLAADLPQHV